MGALARIRSSLTYPIAATLLLVTVVPVAFVGLLKLAGSWFPPHLFGMVAGMALFFGIVGAVGAGPPLRLLVDAYGWLSPCQLVRSLGFSLRQVPFREGWYDLLPALMSSQDAAEGVASFVERREARFTGR